MKKIFFLFLSIWVVFIFSVQAKNNGESHYALSSIKISPSYFIPNQSFNKSKTRIISNNPETVAFIQTMKGVVQFTPKGAYIGIPVREENDTIPEREKTLKAKRLNPIDEREMENNKRLVVMGLGFGSKYKTKSKKSITPKLEQPTGAKVNFYIGKKENWQVDVPTYKKLVYPEVWDGIDVEYIGYMDKLEYRVIVKPYSNPEEIIMETGAESLKLNEDGSLTAELKGGKVVIGRPYAYQEIGGRKVEVPIHFRILDNGRYTFEIGEYDRSKTLIIDPTIVWSKYLRLNGDGYDYGLDIVLDAYDNIYVVGTVESQSAGYSEDSYNDVFISKFDSYGNTIWTTFFGGQYNDWGNSIILDTSGNIYVTGSTNSDNFPVTDGTAVSGYWDVYVSKFDSSGNLVWSTLLGGDDNDFTYSIGIDSIDNIYITGATKSLNFPTTDGSTNSGDFDVFIAKYNSNGVRQWSKLLGGSGGEAANSIAIDSSDNIYITGDTGSYDFPVTNGSSYSGGVVDAYIMKYDTNGNMIWSTLLGGSDFDKSMFVAVENSGNIYIMGFSNSSNFPTTDGSTNSGHDDVFVSKFDSDANMIWSTLLGGSDYDDGYFMAIDNTGNIYITGQTISSDFPVTDGSTNLGYYDILLMELNSNGDLQWSTLLGGTYYDSGYSIAVDSLDNIYIIGETTSPDFPVTNASIYSGENDVFLIKLALNPTSLPPVFIKAEGKGVYDVLPIASTFSCDVYDPDGGDIVQYIWQINGDTYSDTVITFTNTCRYVFTKPGKYHISVTAVDDEGEATTAILKNSSGDDVCICVKRRDDFKVVLPLLTNFGNKTKSINMVNLITDIVNISNQTVNFTINYYDSSGNNVETQNYTIEPNGKFIYNPETYNSANYPYALIEADNYVLACTKVITDSGQMASYLLYPDKGMLYIPHIAEETDYWETEMYLSALHPTDATVTVYKERKDYTLPQFFATINLEDLIGENVDEAKTWGIVESRSNNPVGGGSEPLSGFEIFQHNGTDGAAVELQSSGSQTLFIPHIPEETDIFWTGFTIVNPNDEDANLTIDLYTSAGEKVSTVNLTIPAESKLKGLASDLFGDAYGNAEWGIIRSDKDIFGIELYGTVANGICGYSLPTIATTEGYLPELITGDNLWNGIAITNPSNEDATVSISLVSSDGTVKMTKEIQLGSMERFKSVVKDFFEGVDIESTDYIYYHSTTSVLAIEVSGDLDRTFMFSLIGRE